MTLDSATDSAHSLPGFLEDDRLSLLIFGGKGGVGKTTSATATALHLAASRPDRSYLLVSTDPAHSLRDCVAGDTLPANLTLREIDPQDSLAKFRAKHQEHLRTIVLRGTLLAESDIGELLDLSMPGLDEIMALIEIVDWVNAKRYACIVVDTAPAGHTLRLLALPEIMRKWLVVLDAMLTKHRFIAQLFARNRTYQKDEADLYIEKSAADLRSLWTLLRSPTQCRFVPVMLAETLSVYITGRMMAELASLRIPVREVLVNRLYESAGDCPTCGARMAGQAALVAEITRSFADQKLWGLPLLVEEPRGTQKLASLLARASPLPAWTKLPAALPQQSSSSPVAVANPARLPPPTTKLLLFAGKGGVGKTTLACASALRLAEEWKDKEILLFSIDPAHSLSACLNQKIGPTVTRVARGLCAIEVDAQTEFERLRKLYADEITAVFDRISAQARVHIEFDQEVMERLLDAAPPGLDEVIAITRIVELMDDGHFDLFILDTAPTGHLIRLLEMPELIEAWLRAMFEILLKYRNVVRLPNISAALVDLSKRIKKFRNMMADPKQSALMAVTIPTELAFAETSDLLATCARMRVAVPALFVNMVTPAAPCPTCSALAHRELGILSRFGEAFGKQAVSLEYHTNELDRDRLTQIGRSMYAGPGQ